MVNNFVQKHRNIILYGIALATILFLLQFLQYKLVIIDNSLEIYIFLNAIIFTGLGIWLAKKLVSSKTNTVIETIEVEKVVFIDAETIKGENSKQIKEIVKVDLGLSARELEVLILIEKGLSNQEIAANLFLSLSTVKSHTSKLFEKMSVKRRTQAIEKGKRLHVI